MGKRERMIDVIISEETLDPLKCAQLAQHPATGGTVQFIGTVRNNTKGKNVVRLEFEAFKSMAVSEMEKIAQQVVKNWGAYAVVIHHRVGVLAIEDIAVIITVATPHRKAAFEACEYAIDTLKQTVPIWKKEIFEDGEVWVAAHP